MDEIPGAKSRVDSIQGSPAKRTELVRKLITKYGASGFVAVVFGGLFWRQCQFVNRYAVNMMFWDQWDFYTPIMNGNWWRIFIHQHGPHRQGAGFLITAVLAKLSGWNSRWDAFGVSYLILLAAILAIPIARRCGVRSGFAMTAVPLLFFNIRQYEMFAGASNLSHGAMPILLLMLYCLAWFITGRVWRLAILSFLTFLLIFTGFGLFMGLITPLVLVVELAQAVRARETRHLLWVSGALLLIAFFWLIFSRGYHFEPAVAEFKFPHKRPLEYLYFMALMLANFYGVPGHGFWPMMAGGCAILGLIFICFRHAKLMLMKGIETGRENVVIFSLSAFALFYLANTAVGRVCLGLVEAPAASRYVTLLSAGGFAIFLQLGSMRSAKFANIACVAYALLLLAGTLNLRPDDWASVHWLHNGRLAWREAYLETNDERSANQRSGFKVYPDSDVITGHLEYLRQHRLNLFSEKRE
ncbi:MAG: hypothetical protein WCH43_07720 [Verrucomicrobiota bacterium]